MKLNVCHVGCGSMSTRYYGPAYFTYLEHYPDTKLSACCDINKKSAEIFSNMLGFEHHYVDVDEMIERESPDVVVIVVPENAVASVASKVMEKGVPVLLEKPPGKSPDELSNLIQIARRKKVKNQVNFNRRFMPIIKALKNIINENDWASRINYIREDFWRVQRRESNFHLTAIHAIDLVKYISRRNYTTLKFYYQPLDGAYKNFSNFYLSGEMENNIKVNLNFIMNSGVMVERILIAINNFTIFCYLPAWGSIDKQGKILIFENGKIREELDGNTLIDGIEDPEEPHFMGFYEQLRSGFEDIREGRFPASNLEEFVQTMEIARHMELGKETYNGS
ncbi:MAG: Gfo/Idh/MocA family protein [Promethearchaeota archaeon]